MASMAPKGRQAYTAERIKQLYPLAEDCSAETELAPFFCVEARIDFNDVRTGFRETVSLSKALQIYSDNAEFLWTKDMVRDVNPLKTSTSAPEGVRINALPGFVDANFLARMENQFVQYLLRHFEIRIFRNFDLNLYSFSGESGTDFRRRCKELFESPRRYELDRLYDVFARRLEQARQKYLGGSEIPGLEQAKSESLKKDMFSRHSERISQLFYDSDLRNECMTEPPQFSSQIPEIEEKLMAIEHEAKQALAMLHEGFDEKSRAIDEYILHPNLKDIHFVRSCILWMPKGTA